MYPAPFQITEYATVWPQKHGEYSTAFNPCTKLLSPKITVFVSQMCFVIVASYTFSSENWDVCDQ